MDKGNGFIERLEEKVDKANATVGAASTVVAAFGIAVEVIKLFTGKGRN